MKVRIIISRLHMWCSVYLSVICTPTFSRRSRSDILDMFHGGDAITIDESHWNPFAADARKNRILDKQITKLKQLQSISRDELAQRVLVNAYGFMMVSVIIKGAVTAFKLLSDALSGALKPEATADINMLHPNISKLLKPNCTLNAFELEILQVHLITEAVHSSLFFLSLRLRFQESSLLSPLCKFRSSLHPMNLYYNADSN
jgi:hypothetical protein